MKLWIDNGMKAFYIYEQIGWERKIIKEFKNKKEAIKGAREYCEINGLDGMDFIELGE